jgi:uracil-DNA glycosylase
MAGELEPGWQKAIGTELTKPYMLDLKNFLVQEKEAGHITYPKNKEIFNAFNITPFDKVEVVIIGQDPYHGPNQAHGLSFSVREGVPAPPSLKNIYKELATDIPGFRIPQTGDLTKWAEQGVLLLNATLTVRAATAGSHQKKAGKNSPMPPSKPCLTRKPGWCLSFGEPTRNQKACLLIPTTTTSSLNLHTPLPLQ